MIVTSTSVRSIADMEAQAQQEYLQRVKSDVRWAKEERQRQLVAIAEGRRDAMLLIGTGFEVETSSYAPFREITVRLGNAADGKKGSKQRAASARAVKDKKVLIARLFKSHLEDYSKNLVEGKEKSGLVEITLRVAKAPHVLVKLFDVLPEEVDTPDGPRCKIVKRTVRRAPCIVEYSLECQR